MGSYRPRHRRRRWWGRDTEMRAGARSTHVEHTAGPLDERWEVLESPTLIEVRA